MKVLHLVLPSVRALRKRLCQDVSLERLRLVVLVLFLGMCYKINHPASNWLQQKDGKASAL